MNDWVLGGLAGKANVRDGPGTIGVVGLDGEDVTQGPRRARVFVLNVKRFGRENAATENTVVAVLGSTCGQLVRICSRILKVLYDLIREAAGFEQRRCRGGEIQPWTHKATFSQCGEAVETNWFFYGRSKIGPPPDVPDFSG